VSLRGTSDEAKKQTTTHVELSEKGLWTRVQIPPAPPDASLKAANNIPLAAFFLGKSVICFIGDVNEFH
jgi:hypothetical protein